MPLQTPFHELTSSAGPRFEPQDGWLIPADFGDRRGEYEQTCRRAAIFDISHHGQVELVGRDAGKFLHNLCTNDVLKLAIGDGCEAFLTTSQAKTVAYVLVYRGQAEQADAIFHLDAGPCMGERVAQHLDRYLISEQVEIADRTGELGYVHVAGPKALEVLENALSANLSALQDLKQMQVSIGGHTIQVRKHSPLGLPGFDIRMLREQANSLWASFLAAGAAPAGTEAYQTLRVEAGMPQFGIDIDESNLPQEVNRVEQTISFTKGCYIGQETIARVRTYGHVNRTLVRLKLEGQETEPRGTKLFRDGKEAGQITSCVFSPRRGTAIALAYVRRGNQEPGTELYVGEPGKRAAEVFVGEEHS
jgi:folate-binding protein YgfZ